MPATLVQRFAFRFFILAALLISGATATAQTTNKTIRALLITGGCCHDYAGQTRILTNGINTNAVSVKIDWTVAHQGGTATSSKIPLHEKSDWAKGYDIVVHNECFADVDDVAWVKNVTKPHYEGVPAVVIHCAMHTYRAAKTDDWHQFLGVASYHHEANRVFEINVVKPEHPIMKGFPLKWKTPVADELYVIKKQEPTATTLAEAYGVESKANQTCIWINQYGKARVFGLTTGHFNETLADPDYLALISRGFLWAAGRLE